MAAQGHIKSILSRKPKRKRKEKEREKGRGCIQVDAADLACVTSWTPGGLGELSKPRSPSLTAEVAYLISDCIERAPPATAASSYVG
ncbi:Uncharacterized protein HZ326_13678 [Fusarium oxysporum f. sp. albedinis]|jgi:hypothetical protein|nr:Uncharacterized protein HZ326_13678 [Fusarium oxysporum f. sp. albedinis]